MDHNQLIVISFIGLLAVSLINKVGPLRFLSRLLIYVRATGYAVKDQVGPVKERVRGRWVEYKEKAQREL